MSMLPRQTVTPPLTNNERKQTPRGRRDPREGQLGQPQETSFPDPGHRARTMPVEFGPQPLTENPAAALAAARTLRAQKHSQIREFIASQERSADKQHDGYLEFHPGVGRDEGIMRASGRYQLTTDMLADTGWKTKTGSWAARALEHGVRTEQEFLNNPAAQEQAMTDALSVIERNAAAAGLFDYAGKSYEGKAGKITVTPAGIMAAVHRQGAGETKKYFQRLEELGRLQNQELGATRNDALKSSFAAIETRLRRAFENDVPYERSTGR